MNEYNPAQSAAHCDHVRVSARDVIEKPLLSPVRCSKFLFQIVLTFQITPFLLLKKYTRYSVGRIENVFENYYYFTEVGYYY